MEDPGPWLWYSAPIRITDGAYASNQVWITPVHPPIITNAPTIVWGDWVSFSGPGIGLLNVSAAFLADIDHTVMLPCINATAQPRDILSCTLQFVSSLWLDKPMYLVLILEGVSQVQNTTILLPNTWRLTAAPQALVIAIPPVLSGTSEMSFILPQPPWASEEVEAIGIAPNCALYVGLYRRIIPCPIVATVTVIPPLGWGVHLPVVFELNGVLNVSIGLASYAHAGIKQITSSVVALKPSIPSDAVQLTLELVDARDGALMSNVSIAGAQCIEHSHNGTLYKCTLLSSVLQFLAEDMDALPYRLQFDWADGNVTATLPGTIIVRPTLTSVTPQLVSSGSMLVAFGAHFCGAEACAHAGINVMIGAYECSNVNVISDAVLTCIVPLVTPETRIFPTTMLLSKRYLEHKHARQLASYSLPAAFVQAVAPLPSMFTPSDESAPWPLPFPITVQVRSSNNAPPVEGYIECSLTTTTPGALLLPITLGISINWATYPSSISVWSASKHHFPRAPSHFPCRVRPLKQSNRVSLHSRGMCVPGP
jgi:hypothetical protein